MVQHVSGQVVRGPDVAAEYAGLRVLDAPAVHTHIRATSRCERLCAFDVDDVIVTSGFLPVDVSRGRLFLDQSYGGIERLPLPFQPFRPEIEGGRFRLASDPLRHEGRHVLVGGPIDEVWYHWLYNWAPRLLLLRRLRPELWRDPDVRFIVQSKALWPQFRAVMEALGVPDARLTVIDLDRDHRFERVTVLPFLHQDLLFPDILRDFAAALGPELARGAPRVRGQDLFLSRQALEAPKRRVDNFGQLAPVLAAHGVRVVDCGQLSAAEQARAFRDAPRVIAGHGSDLANLMFCRPGTQVLVFEHAASIGSGHHVLLRELCRIFELNYEVMIPVSVGPEGVALAQQLRADYRVNVVAVDAWLARSAFAAERMTEQRSPEPPRLLRMLKNVTGRRA